MHPTPDLDDINQTVVYIPYSGQDDDTSDDDLEPNSCSPYDERDLVDGYVLRMNAYRAAWDKCLDRIQAIIRTLYAPVLDTAVQYIRDAHSDILPALPYEEIPVVSLSGIAILSLTNAKDLSPTTLLNDITEKVVGSHHEDDDTGNPSPQRSEIAFVTHLYPAECTNITLTMKALINGFIKKPPNEHDAKTNKRTTTSVANYDIELLAAWYEAIRGARGIPSHPSLHNRLTIQDVDPKALPLLIVLLCDFEQFDTTVVKDLLYICSLHISRLPFVFILSLSGPPSPSYLHSTYPRSTLALLRVRNFSVPSGSQVLEEILSKTFFDTEFEPDIIVGPVTLSYLVEHFTRHHSSVDSILTVLQLAHMKHFEEPQTLFVHDSLLGTTRPDLAADLLLQPESFTFLDSIFSRLQKFNPVASIDLVSEWRAKDVRAVLASVDEARLEVKARARRMRVAFRLMGVVRKFLVQQGHKTAESEWNVPEMMVAAMRGRLRRDGKYLGMMVRKISNPELAALIDELYRFFREMPLRVWQEENGAIDKVITCMNAMPSDRSVSVVELANDLGEWLVGYFRNNLSFLEESNLWDIWYTGLSPFPSELINPSIRACIISGLLNPFDYVNSDPSNGDSDDKDERTYPALWELPDNSILFRRYLDSGKLINVYDWFESFSVVLESQREHLSKKRQGGSPGKVGRKSNGKGKGKQKVDEEEEEEEDGESEDEDKWKREVQARFMRALQELDYLGFIKHTGRKADHVIRTVFDIPD